MLEVESDMSFKESEKLIKENDFVFILVGCLSMFVLVFVVLFGVCSSSKKDKNIETSENVVVRVENTTLNRKSKSPLIDLANLNDKADSFSLSGVSGNSRTSQSSAVTTLSVNTANTFRSKYTFEDKKRQEKVQSLRSSSLDDIVSDMDEYESDMRKIDDLVDKVYQMISEEETEEVVEFSKFLLGKEANIEMKAYLVRLVEGINLYYTDDEEAIDAAQKGIGSKCLIFSVAHLDSLCRKKGTVLSLENGFKLFATMMLIAGKFMEDSIMSNQYWSEVCGMSLAEVNDLEEVLCFSMGFNFFISREEFKQMVKFFMTIEM